jgi:hypothetical protein
MSRISPLASALGLVVLGARSAMAECVSYGMDFQNGKTYFQNSNSPDNFTFVSQFEGMYNLHNTSFHLAYTPFQAASQILRTTSSWIPPVTKCCAPIPI